MRRSSTLVFWALLSVTATTLHASDDPPSYSLKESEPHVGTNIPREMVKGSRVPLDKRYADFTPEQKALVRSQYEAMHPADEPPWPIDGLGVVYRQLSEAQRRLQIVDDISLMVEVGSDGNPRSVSSYKKSDDQLVRALSYVLMQQKFKPALCSGEPCVMPFPVRLSFRHAL